MKDAFIELILKKTIQVKWESLEPKEDLQTKKKGDDSPSSKINKVKTPTKRGQQLLGGKSTPLTKGDDKQQQDSEVKVDSNLPGLQSRPQLTNEIYRRQ